MLLVDIKSRSIIMKHMIELHKKILQSQSASYCNDEYPFITLKQEDAVFENAFLYNTDMHNSINLLRVLNIGYKYNSMQCHALAVYLAIKIYSDSGLSDELKEQIKICTIASHTFVCIGSINQKNSIVADGWPAYLSYKAKSGYRPKDVLHYYKQRGFMGTMEQYLKFLSDNPNKYVPKGVSMEVKIHDFYTANIKAIALSDIENIDPEVCN